MGGTRSATLQASSRFKSGKKGKHIELSFVFLLPQRLLHQLLFRNSQSWLHPRAGPKDVSRLGGQLPAILRNLLAPVPEALFSQAYWAGSGSVRSLLRAIAAVFLGTCLFILIGTGAVTSGCHLPDVSHASGNANDVSLISAPFNSCAMQSTSLLNVAAAFGFALFAAIFATAPFSGGNLNPAVTFALFLNGRVSALKGFLFVITQCLGAIVASALVKSIDHHGFNAAGGAANAINHMHGISVAGAWAAETILTFALVFTVFAASYASHGHKFPHLQVMAPLGIAMVVFTSHFILVPIDGCSLNPARSFGPAVISGNWDHHWIFWIGPCSGAIFACVIYELICRSGADHDQSSEQEEDHRPQAADMGTSSERLFASQHNSVVLDSRHPSSILESMEQERAMGGGRHHAWVHRNPLSTYIDSPALAESNRHDERA